MMKKVLIALGFTMSAMSSQAALVFNAGGLTAPTNAYNDILKVNAGATFQYGSLSAQAGDVITFTNLIKNVEAGYKNLFINGTEVFSNKTGNNNSFSYTAATSGALNFKFISQGGFTDFNGSKNIAVLSNVKGFSDQFLLLLDDSFKGHRDFDDHSVGVSAVSAVPVPAALPLMASALGAFGIARRRNKAKVAK